MAGVSEKKSYSIRYPEYVVDDRGESIKNRRNLLRLHIAYKIALLMMLLLLLLEEIAKPEVVLANLVFMSMRIRVSFFGSR